MRPSKSPLPPLILASTSIYRKALLEQLMVPFSCQAPLCDEEQLKNRWSDPAERAQNLARAKAESLSKSDNCVIGGDQLVEFEGQILGKPKTAEKAIEQLKLMQGKTHRLMTAVCLFHQKEAFPLFDITEMKMKALSDQQIKAYVAMDQPLDCAGSYKIEKHGMALFEKINCADMSAIQGLPLLSLSQILQKLGYQIPGV